MHFLIPFLSCLGCAGMGVRMGMAAQKAKVARLRECLSQAHEDYAELMVQSRELRKNKAFKVLERCTAGFQPAGLGWTPSERTHFAVMSPKQRAHLVAMERWLFWKTLPVKYPQLRGRDYGEVGAR